MAEEQYAVFMEKGLKRVDPLLAIKPFSGGSTSQVSIEFGIQWTFKHNRWWLRSGF